MQAIAQAIDTTLFSQQLPGCILQNTAGQAFTSSSTTLTAMTFDSEVYDPSNLHSSGSATRITTSGAGTQLWAVWAAVTYPNNSAGHRELTFRVQGAATNYWHMNEVAQSGTLDRRITTSGLLAVTGGNYIEVFTLQNSGSTLTTVANSGWFAAARIK
jgi:hypothetical protein